MKAPQSGSRSRDRGEIHSEVGGGPPSGSHAGVRDEIHNGADREVARIASGQRGLVTRPQLLDAGLTVREIRTRRESSRLHLIHPGVYAVGHPALAPHGRELAALLWAGPEAVLSHTTAAMLWNLLPAGPGPVHITRPPPHRRAPDDVILHRVPTIALASLRRPHGLNVTDPARTLQDLAALGNADELARSVNEAQVRRLVRAEQLHPQPGTRGAALLRAVLDAGPTPTRSEAERRLISLILTAQLPRPETNAHVGRYEVDALWSDRKVIVEVDGFAAHGTRAAFERDRLRDQALQAAGYRVLRLTWRQLTAQPTAAVARLAAALA